MNDSGSKNLEKKLDSPEKRQQQEFVDKTASDRLNNNNLGLNFSEADHKKQEKTTGSDQKRLGATAEWDNKRDSEFTDSYLDTLILDKSPVVRAAGEFIKDNNVDLFIDKPENFKDSTGNVNPYIVAASGQSQNETGDWRKYIRYNEAWVDKESDDELKATIAHEVKHLQGGDEVEAWRAQAATGYSLDAKMLCNWSDGTSKGYLTVKEELIKYGYRPEDFHS
jgi:hypothetical protein